MVTLGDLVLYVLNNRRGNAFKDYSEHDIASNILQAVNNNGILHYAVNDNGTICGIVVASRDEEAKKIFVDDILTTEDWVFKKFIEILRDNYSKYRIHAQRWKGTSPAVVRYNVNKLINKVLGA